MENMTAEKLVQVGMRAAIRDIQDYIDDVTHVEPGITESILDAEPLKAYLLAMLITSGAFEDLTDAAA